MTCDFSSPFQQYMYFINIRAMRGRLNKDCKYWNSINGWNSIEPVIAMSTGQCLIY